MPDEKKKDEMSIGTWLLIAVVFGLIGWWYVSSLPDTRKMTDEQYQNWDRENTRQYP